MKNTERTTQTQSNETMQAELRTLVINHAAEVYPECIDLQEIYVLAERMAEKKFPDEKDRTYESTKEIVLQKRVRDVIWRESADTHHLERVETGRYRLNPALADRLTHLRSEDASEVEAALAAFETAEAIRRIAAIN